MENFYKGMPEMMLELIRTSMSSSILKKLGGMDSLKSLCESFCNVFTVVLKSQQMLDMIAYDYLLPAILD